MKHFTQIVEILEYVVLVINLIGILLIIFGFVKGFFHHMRAEYKSIHGHDIIEGTKKARIVVGTYMLLGLEFLIASDIILSVVRHNLSSLAELAGIVVIRTAIAYFLGKEIEQLKGEIS
ncbi:MAG: DUF1622 domain-containing protein [Hyphomicrobiales bacterium]